MASIILGKLHDPDGKAKSMIIQRSCKFDFRIIGLDVGLQKTPLDAYRKGSSVFAEGSRRWVRHYSPHRRRDAVYTSAWIAE
jgi:hypothetical protein